MNGQADEHGEHTAESSENEGMEEATAAGDAEPRVPAEGTAPDEELQTKADENWDRYLRAAAELENVRKRASRDVENARKFALERFARDLLEVRDSLEMGIAAGTDAGAEALLEGSTATLKQLTATMAQYGVADVDPLGEPFDPELHEAMTMQPSAEAEPGSVLTVFQKGYTLNGRLLRPARVVVAQAPAEEGE